MGIQEWKDITGLILQLINLLVIVYGGYKFLNKPHDTLADEVKKIEKAQNEQALEIKEVKKSLDVSFTKHREQDITNKVFKKVFILLANFEVAFCQYTGYEHTEDLIEAKKELENYLANE